MMRIMAPGDTGPLAPRNDKRLQEHDASQRSTLDADATAARRAARDMPRLAEMGNSPQIPGAIKTVSGVADVQTL
jgi:hypothetical protein